MSDLLLGALVGWALFSVVVIHDAPAQRPCYSCEEGLKPCKKSTCSPKKICGTRLEHVCDALYRAKCCQGFRKVPCPRCKAEAGRLARRAFDRERRRWLKQMREIDLLLGQRYSHVETAHFIIHNCHEEWIFKARKTDRVRGAHIWAERLEAVWKRVEEEFGRPSGKGKHQLFLNWTRDQHLAAHRHYGDPKVSNAWAGYNGQQGEVCNFFIYPDQVAHYTDRGMEGFVHHLAALAVVGRIAPKGRLPVWILKGAAHWLDLDKSKFAKDLNAFSADRNEWNKEDKWFEKHAWPKQIAAYLKKEKVELKSLFARSSTDTIKGQALAWSLVSYLKRKEAGGKMRLLVAELAEGKNFEAALQEIYGQTLDEFEAGWRKFAIAAK
jgi:hypothetical protein